MFNVHIIDDALVEVIQRVQRSLVVVHNGRRGAGAGVVWRPGGLIITNNHVVGRAQAYATLPDGETLPARLVARDEAIDLALLQVDDAQLPAAQIADSRGVKVGSFVFALGHPWGQRNFVSGGIVSGLGQAAVRNGRGSIPILRSDVYLAPGNSGGPLINATGGVIGINTLIVGGDQAVAIPSHVVGDFVARALGESEAARV